MPSLREIQRQFAATILAGDGAAPPFGTAPAAVAAERIAVYRRAFLANYRNALGASFPVVRRLVGAPFFHAAVDAFVRAHPSRSGDLNVYGDAFGDFLAGYAPAAELPYLADVARLEWAQDEANCAADATPAPDSVLASLAAVAPERLPAVRLTLAPSCRLVESAFPVLAIWQANQGDADGSGVSLDAGPDRLLVRREFSGVTIERLATAEHAWLAATASGATLGEAIGVAQRHEADFDLQPVLARRIADGAISGVVA